MTLKQKENPPFWKNLATYWLTTDIYKYTKAFHFLMNNNRIKTANGKKPFNYKDIIDYIKNQNKNIPNIKPEKKSFIKTYYNSTQNNIKQQVKYNGKIIYQI